MKKLFFAVAIIFMTSGLNSCSNSQDEFGLNESNLTSQNVSSLKEKSIQNIAKDLVEVSKRMSINPDLILDNYDGFTADLDNGVVFSSESVQMNEFTQIFDTRFGMNQSATQEFYNIIYNNRDFFVKNDPQGTLLRDAVIEEFKTQIADTNGNTQKLIFSSIFEISGSTNCGYGVMAAFADTAISAVVTAVTAPTGIGAVAGAASTAASYATLVYRAAKCKGRNYH